MVKPGLPKLIATDLDGTLVRSDDTVSEYTHSVLDRVRAAGIRIVGATGRGPRLSELTRNDIRAADFLVLAQGGWVLDETDPVPLRAERLPGRVLAGVLEDLEAALGPLSVMVEALPEADAPLWGDLDPTWRYPVTVIERPRAECVTGDVIKAFVRSVDYHVDDLLELPWSPRPSASTRRTSWSSATCPTTCRCSRGPAGPGWPWPTPTRRSWRSPTRSP